MLERERWTMPRIVVALLGAGSALLPTAGMVLADSRLLRTVEAGGAGPAGAPLPRTQPRGPVDSTPAYLVARANGAPLAQVTPMPVSSEASVRVILAPDARGPLPPAVTLPADQVPRGLPVWAATAPGPAGASAPLLTASSSQVASVTNSARPGAAASPPATATGAPGTAAGPAPLLGNAASVTAAAGPSGNVSGSRRVIPNLPATANGARVLSVALAQVGARYTWGGTSPSTGFDCSGFISYVFSTLGYRVDRMVEEQFANGRRVPLDQLRPGDIVFYENTYMPGLSHNGIYVGDGKFVHAADETLGVVTTAMDAAYWEQRYVGAVRVVD